MEEKQLHILTSREFWQLSSEEKMALQGWFENEDEYNQLRALFQGVNRLKTEFVGAENPSSKVQLDRLFTEVYSNKSSGGIKDFLYQRGKMFYMQPIFQIGLAASVIVGLFLYNPQQNVDVKSASQHGKIKKNPIQPKNEPIQTKKPVIKPELQLPEPTTVVASLDPSFTNEISLSEQVEDVAVNSVATTEMLDEEKTVVMGGTFEEKPSVTAIDQTLAFSSAPASATVTTGATTSFSPNSSAYKWTSIESKNSADKSGKKIERSEAFAKDFDNKDLPLTAPSAAERSDILEGLYTTF